MLCHKLFPHDSKYPPNVIFLYQVPILGQTNYVFSLAILPACFLDRHFRLYFINLRGRGAHFRVELTEKG